MSREIEIKVRVKDTSALVQFLDAQAEFMGEQHQVDEYFTPPDRDFTATRPTVDEWLRLRTSDKGSSINYKYWHRDEAGSSLYADEYESPVGSVESLREILAALKFRSLCVVDKVRKTWRIVIPDPNTVPDQESSRSEGKHGSRIKSGMTEKELVYEIALDREKTLGDFVEVELIGETTDDVATVRQQMLQFLHAHGISDPDADQVGYPYLILFGDSKR